MRSQYLGLIAVVVGVSMGLSAGCASKQVVSPAPPVKLGSQQLTDEIQKIQNNPQIPADEKARLIQQLQARNAAQR